MGKTMVFGGGRTAAPVTGTPLSSLAVGSVVRLNENGSPVDYLVVHQGLPSTLYDSSCDGTWLLRKDIHSLRMWHSSSQSYVAYAVSAIHVWLNETFFNTFGSAEQRAIKSVKIPYGGYNSNQLTAITGSNGLSAKVFLLINAEVGDSSSNIGAKLDYFLDDPFDEMGLRVAYFNGAENPWWLRGTNETGMFGVIGVMGGGTAGYIGSAMNTYGVRPCIILSSNAVMTDDGTIKV